MAQKIGQKNNNTKSMSPGTGTIACIHVKIGKKLERKGINHKNINRSKRKAAKI